MFMLTILAMSFAMSGANLGQAPGRTFAFVVGIDSYSDSGIKALSGAVADADNFANWLVQSAKVPAANVIKLTSKTDLKPTREVLLGAGGLVQKWQLRKNDTLIMYYAGHAVDVQGNAYLIPFDGRRKAKIELGVTLDQIGRPAGAAPPTALAGADTGISATDPQQLNWLSCEAVLSAVGQNAGTMIAFFDMCRGQAWDTTDIPVNKALTTSIMNSTNPGRLPADLAPQRIGVLHSCSRDQTSEETGGHGRFSSTLEIGLRSGSADLDKDGKVTYGEVYRFLKAQISKATAGKQVPFNREEGDVGDFVLATIKLAQPKPGGRPTPGVKPGTKGVKPPEPTPAEPLAQIAQLDERSLYSDGTYSVLPGPKWIDLTSGEGGFTARIPDEDVNDPRSVRRVENKVSTPAGEVTSKTYVYERQDGYAYRRYAATVLDYPIKIDPAKQAQQEKDILQFGKDLAAKKKKTPLDDLVLGDSAAATMLRTEITKVLAEKVDVNKILASTPLKPLLGFLGGGNKGPQTLFQVGYSYNIGQHPGFRIEWRKLNEGFGVLQIGVISNRLYILSEIYAGGNGRMPSGVVPRLFIDSFAPTVPMIARPEQVIGFVGG